MMKVMSPEDLLCMKSLSEGRVKIKEYVHSSNMSRERFDCEGDRNY